MQGYTYEGAISDLTAMDSMPGTYTRRGDVQGKVHSIAKNATTSIRAFKGFVVSDRPYTNSDGIALMKVRNPRSLTIECKLSTPIGGRDRVRDYTPTKGDVVYCIHCMDDDYPIIFAFPNGHSGNRQWARLEPGEERDVYRNKTYMWHKINGSCNFNIRNNYLLEVANDFKSIIKNNYTLEVKDTINISSVDRTWIYAGSFLNLKSAKNVNIRSEWSSINMRAAKNFWAQIDGKVELKCANILLGASEGHELALKGTTAQLEFNTHTHIGNLGFPTAPPTVPMNALASEVKVV